MKTRLLYIIQKISLLISIWFKKKVIERQENELWENYRIILGSDLILIFKLKSLTMVGEYESVINKVWISYKNLFIMADKIRKLLD
jgi:hypothetical protein